MRRFSKFMVGAVVAAGVLAPVTVGTTANAATATQHATAAVRPADTYKGCDSGYACMYTPTGWGGGWPQKAWYYYGCYSLSGYSGGHYFYNNQTGGALLRVYPKPGCAGTPTTIKPGGEKYVVINGNYSVGLIA